MSEPSEEAWNQAREQLASLGDKLAAHYRRLVGEEGPQEEQVRDALRTLGAAFDRVMESLGTAARDPEVRETLRGAATSLASAVGATFSRLGEELRRDRAQDPPTSG
jgi:hypothetical protein